MDDNNYYNNIAHWLSKWSMFWRSIYLRISLSTCLAPQHIHKNFVLTVNISAQEQLVVTFKLRLALDEVKV